MVHDLFIEIQATGVAFVPWSNYSAFLETCELFELPARAGESTNNGIYFYL